MPTLAAMTAALDAELKLSEIPDYPGAHNGLQLANRSGRVATVVAAVDACLPVVRAAAEVRGPSLLIVHHGMLWSGVQRMVGSFHAKLQAAMDADLAIFSAHIPLDVHPVLGNNAQLAAALGFRKTVPFFDWKGIRLGLRASPNVSREALAAKLGRAVAGPVHVCPGGPQRVQKVGIITGGAGGEIAAAAATGIDTFITGEGPHWSFTAAEELGLNLLYAGHYATETFGVKAAAAWLARKFRVPWRFIDHPSGL